MQVNTYATLGQANQATAQGIYNQIVSAEKPILLFLSGGSTISTAAAILDALSEEQLGNLTIVQVDERYGRVGHKDSNWRAISNALSSKVLENSKIVPMLEVESDPEAIVEQYEDWLKEEMPKSLSIGLLGMGEDGHVAGMLPGTDQFAEQFLGHKMFVSYEGPDFERITMTGHMLSKLDLITVLAGGKSKWQAYNRLASGTADPASLPVLVLKDLGSATFNFGRD